MNARPALPTARYERFDGLQEYEDRLDALIPRALSVIRVFEHRLSARYNSRARTLLLREFLRGDTRRRLRVVVHEANALALACPRLLTLAQDYHPRVELRRTTPAARRAEDPCMIVDFSHYLHRFHYASTRAAQGVDELAGAQQLIDRHEQIWESASPVHVGRPAGL